MSRKEPELGVTVSEQTVEWTIRNFECEIRRIVCSKSRSFHVAEMELRLSIFCTHYLTDGDPVLSLKLSAEAELPGRRNCTIGVRKCDGSVFKSIRAQCLSFPIDPPVEIVNFVKLSEILGEAMSEDGTVTVFCTLSTSSGQTTEASSPECPAVDAAEGTTSPESVKPLAQYFKELYISGLHSDVVIKVEDREFQAHMCVLSVRSPVFAAMFQHEMAEKTSGVVDIADCDARCFEAFLLFLYTADAVHVTPENAVGLFTTAEKYQVKDLKKACVQFLKGHLHVGTVCDAVHLAVLHDETELLDAATEFFISNWSAILTTPQWKKFIVENTLMANDLLIQKANRHDN